MYRIKGDDLIFLYCLVICLHCCDLFIDAIFPGVRADVEKLIEETCHDNLKKFSSNRLRPINRKPLSELFVEFLEKVDDHFHGFVHSGSNYIGVDFTVLLLYKFHFFNIV